MPGAPRYWGVIPYCVLPPWQRQPPAVWSSSWAPACCGGRWWWRGGCTTRVACGRVSRHEVATRGRYNYCGVCVFRVGRRGAFQVPCGARSGHVPVQEQQLQRRPSLRPSCYRSEPGRLAYFDASRIWRLQPRRSVSRKGIYHTSSLTGRQSSGCTAPPGNSWASAPRSLRTSTTSPAGPVGGGDGHNSQLERATSLAVSAITVN